MGTSAEGPAQRIGGPGEEELPLLRGYRCQQPRKSKFYTAEGQVLAFNLTGGQTAVPEECPDQGRIVKTTHWTREARTRAGEGLGHSLYHHVEFETAAELEHFTKSQVIPRAKQPVLNPCRGGFCVDSEDCSKARLEGGRLDPLQELETTRTRDRVVDSDKEGDVVSGAVDRGEDGTDDVHEEGLQVGV